MTLSGFDPRGASIKMHAMRWRWKVSKGRALKGLLVLSAISCLLRKQGFDWPRELLAPVLAPLSHAGTYAAGSVQHNVQNLVDGGIDAETARRLTEENQALRRQAIVYQNRLAEQAGRLAEMGRWRRELENDFPCMLIPATVIGRGPMSFQHSRLLRPRRRVSSGQFATTRTLMTNWPVAIRGKRAALGASALVGQIVSSGAWTAHLQLVTDPDFKIQAFVQRLYDPQRPRTILQDNVSRPLAENDRPIPVNLAGNVAGMITAEVPARHGIAEGDVVRTMGDDSRLPIGVLIGTVAGVEPVPNNPKHVRLKVAPSAQLESLRDVYVVIPPVEGDP